MNQRIRSGDPMAVAKLRLKLLALHDEHSEMKRANLAARRAEQPLPHDSAAMRNIWCRMRNVRARLGIIDTTAKHKETLIGAWPPGVEMVLDSEAGRVVFRFEKAPSVKIVRALRSRQFSLASRSREWRRRMSKMAIASAAEIATLIRQEAGL